MFGKIYDILGESLNVLSDRQNIIASNVANIDTPGYKAKVLNFKDVMDDLVSSGSSVSMTSDSTKDLSYKNSYDATRNDYGFIKSFIHNQTIKTVPTLDGNTVDLSKEMTNMTSNAIRFKAVAVLLSKKFALLHYAITQTNS